MKKTQETRTLSFLKKAGSKGASCSEIQSKLPLRAKQISNALNRLHKKGSIRCEGERSKARWFVQGSEEAEVPKEDVKTTDVKLESFNEVALLDLGQGPDFVEDKAENYPQERAKDDITIEKALHPAAPFHLISEDVMVNNMTPDQVLRVWKAGLAADRELKK